MKKLLGPALACTAFLITPITSQAQVTEPPPDPAVSNTGEAATPAPAPTAAPAQPAPQPQPQPVAAPAPNPGWGAGAPAPAAPAPRSDGVRFRGAIAASGGGEFASGFAVGMGGVEGRVGVQINNLLGIYIQPSLAIGGGSINNFPVITGTLGVSALVDFTIADYFFVAAGGGVAMLNNPIAPEIHLRVGGYPVMVVGQDGYSRQGLMVGVDARLFLLPSGPSLVPVAQILGSIGYEVF